MPRAGQRKWLVIFKQVPTSENEYGEQAPTGGPATEIARQRVAVFFGTGQEGRMAAQEKGVQSASLECKRTDNLEPIGITDVAEFDNSDWDIIDRSPISRERLRFTVTRTV
jgi:hypothetical protein